MSLEPKINRLLSSIRFCKVRAEKATKKCFVTEQETKLKKKIIKLTMNAAVKCLN
jgi:hypothetical protein